jgi:hypothetical protein
MCLQPVTGHGEICAFTVTQPALCHLHMQATIILLSDIQSHSRTDACLMEFSEGLLAVGRQPKSRMDSPGCRRKQHPRGEAGQVRIDWQPSGWMPRAVWGAICARASDSKRRRVDISVHPSLAVNAGQAPQQSRSYGIQIRVADPASQCAAAGLTAVLPTLSHRIAARGARSAGMARGGVPPSGY